MICLHFVRGLVRPLFTQPANTHIRTLSQLIRKDGQSVDPNILEQNLRSATTTTDVFDMVEQQQNMTLPQVLSTLKTVFVLQKSGASTMPTVDILKHPGFTGLCNRLKIKYRTIEFNDIVEVIKILSYLGVSPSSELFHMFLELVRQEINRASLMQIVFLDFVLQKLDPMKTPLIEALRITFPILFQMKLVEQIDHENIPQLIDLLGFTSRNKVNRKTAMSILNALILHGDNFTCDEGRKIVWSLCDDVNPPSVQRLRLFERAINCMAKEIDKLSIETVEATTTKMARKFATNTGFYDEQFLNATADTLIQRNVDFVMCCYVLKSFNRMSFVHLRLLNHLVAMVERDPELLSMAKTGILLSFVSSLAIANSSTFNLNSRPALFEAITQNGLFQMDVVHFPWTKFVGELASMGVFHRRLTKWILSSSFLEEYLSRRSTIDYLQVLNFYQSATLLGEISLEDTDDIQIYLKNATNVLISKADYPIKVSLEYAFGGPEYVTTKVLTKHNQLIDHLLMFNGNNDICKMPPTGTDQGYVPLEELTTGGASKLIAVLVFPKSYFTSNLRTIKGIFSLHVRTLEKIGLVPVVVDLELWTQLPDHEKIPYLQREIKCKL